MIGVKKSHGKPLTVEVAIVGGGPAGLTAAIALAEAGIETVLIARRPPPDNRTTALLSGSVDGARDAWRLVALRGASGPADARCGSSMRPPGCCARPRSFEAAEIGLEAFGHNIENRHLIAALEPRAASCRRSRHRGRRIERSTGEDRRHDPAQGRRIAHRADGRRRRWAKIALPRGRRHRATRHEYSQAALTLTSATGGRTTASRPNSTPDRPVHAGAPARHALQPGVRRRTRRGRSARRAR